MRGIELRCAIAHRRISRFRVRCFASPRNDKVNGLARDPPRHNSAPMSPHSRLTWNAGRAMISRTRCGRAGLLILAAGIGMAPVLQAGAQTVPAAEDQEAPAAEPAAMPDADDADINALELDWSQLNVDASTLATRPVSKSRSPQAANSDLSWSSKKNANGS